MITTGDKDVDILLENVVTCLTNNFQYTKPVACEMVVGYYKNFQDSAYCESLGVPMQDDDDWFHEAAMGMALRIHYYVGLKGHPHPHGNEFLEWRREFTLGLKNRRAK